MALGQRASHLHKLVYGITEDGEDDEILNWSFGYVCDDLNAAIWNLSSGYYKTSASCLRNALDLGALSLYFQIRELESTKEGGYNSYFRDWDSGRCGTPSWGTTMPVIRRLVSIQSFNSTNNCDVVDDIYAHFRRLSDYTHGRPWEASGGKPGKPIGSLWLGQNPPEFAADLFDRFVTGQVSPR